MKLLEHEAKQILHSYDIPIPQGSLDPSDVTSFPWVIKSQVPIGGRGKAGGIVIANSQKELEEKSRDLYNLSIKGFRPSRLLYEELLSIDAERYLSFTINQSSKSVELVAHASGGVEIESHDQTEFFRHFVNDETVEQTAALCGDFLDLSDKQELNKIIKNLYRCFVDQDCTLLEINPLVLTRSGTLVAADCKIELDNNAVFRHQDWTFEEKPADANFVTLNPKGNVATIANGAGLAMATVDAVANTGMNPANFLDIGGGANEASVTRAFKAIVAYENIQAIIINIFAGITRCDEVAKAIVGAKQHISDLPPLFIRLDGTNFGEAKIILDAANIELLPTLEDCLTKAKEVVS